MKKSEAIEIIRAEIQDHRRLEAYHRARYAELSPRSARLLRKMERAAFLRHARTAKAKEFLLSRLQPQPERRTV